jgi:ribosome-binding factor A
MSDESHRTARVAGLIQARLGEILTREVNDTELSATVVTGVEISGDLSIAHVRVRRLGVGEPPNGRDAHLARLKRAVRRLRGALGPRLGLRRVPELRFTYDEGPDQAARVDELLREISREPRGKPE